MGLRSIARRVCIAALLSASVVTATARTSTAQDLATARRELASQDVRVRVAAALYLGRAKPEGARELLEEALVDAEPAVRTAAAAALASLGDARALPALEHQAAEETIAGAKAQMERSIASLHAKKQAEGTRYVVQLGSMHNNTHVRGQQLESVLRSAAFSRASAIPGVVVADARAASRLATERHVPLLLIDGNLTGLTQGQNAASVTVHAQVQFVVRRDQTLKASMTGSATAEDSIRALANAQRVAALQNDAVDGAVQSAMRGADTGLALAAR